MDVLKFLHSVRLWQILMLAAVFLLGLGFTGGIPYTEIVLLRGNGERAICAGGALLISSIVIYYHPRGR